MGDTLQAIGDTPVRSMFSGKGRLSPHYQNEPPVYRAEPQYGGAEYNATLGVKEIRETKYLNPLYYRAS